MTRPIYSPATIRDLLERHGFRFSKSLGQNFLIDGNIIEKILQRAQVEDENILEIGPGFGVLSKSLAQRGKKLLLVELDKSLEPVLEEVLEEEREKVRIIFSDVLKIDLQKELRETFGEEKAIVVANLPYYVTTPILARLLEEDLPVKSITVMVQKEVARRMVAKAGTKEYGSLSVLVQYYTKPELAFTVPPTVFMPRPKVDSAVVHMELQGAKKDPVFFEYVHGAFQMRRKTLANAWEKSLGIEKEKTRKALVSLGKQENARGEELTPEEFLALCHRLENKAY